MVNPHKFTAGPGLEALLQQVVCVGNDRCLSITDRWKVSVADADTKSAFPAFNPVVDGPAAVTPVLQVLLAVTANGPFIRNLCRINSTYAVVYLNKNSSKLYKEKNKRLGLAEERRDRMQTTQVEQQPNSGKIRLSGQEAGQAIIEMVLILPLLLLIMAGVFDFGRVLHAYVVVENAAREAAIAGAVEQLSDTSIRNLIDAELQRGGVSGGTAASTITYQSKGSPSAQTLVVNLTYDFPLVILVLPISSVTVRAQVETVTFW